MSSLNIWPNTPKVSFFPHKKKHYLPVINNITIKNGGSIFKFLFYNNFEICWSGQ
jgi:hypothetical protein